MNGILNILKPPGMTSHDVVSRVRRITGIKKVGHTGTLDPQAAGVLPICLGQATKLSQFLLDSRKQYRGEMTLGVETDTQDATGTVIRQAPVQVTEEQIRGTAAAFLGAGRQLPPMYSALKQQGKKLYELARQGLEVERAPREIFIDQIEIIHIKENTVLMDVTCSKGTYIRTLFKDMGDRLGCGAMMSFLLRTATGPFRLEETVTLEELALAPAWERYLYPLDYPLQQFSKISLHVGAEKLALNGNPISERHWQNQPQTASEELVRVYLEAQLVGLAQVITEAGQRHLKFRRMFV